MSIITPSDTALAYLQQFTPGQQRFDLSEQSDTTGHTATRLGGPPRWTVALRTLDALEPAVSALWKAIAVQMRGRVNHMAVHDVTQPQPRGTARGNLITVGTTAAGATSLVLAGALAAPNLLFNSSFETDTNADGLADNWATISAGSVSGLAKFISTSFKPHALSSQLLTTSSLGTTSGDYVGVRQFVATAGAAGVAFACGVSVVATTGSRVRIHIQFRSGGSFVGEVTSADTVSTGAEQRISASGTAPAAYDQIELQIRQSAMPVAGASFLYADAVQLELGLVPTGYSGFATLLAGDWLQVGAGVGSHYCMVSADALANDSGGITVAIEPPTRKSFADSTAVTWDKPKGHYKQRPDSLSWSGAAGSSMVGGFAFDLMEDWSA